MSNKPHLRKQLGLLKRKKEKEKEKLNQQELGAVPKTSKIED